MPRLEQRAEELGFVTANENDIEYLVVNGYNPDREVTVAPLTTKPQPVPDLRRILHWMVAAADRHAPPQLQSFKQSLTGAGGELMQPMYPQQETFRRRLPIVIIGLFTASLILLLRLLSFQFPLDPQVDAYLTNLRDSGYTRTLSLAGARGNIYDRHGEALAVNTLEYRIGASPNLVADARTTATAAFDDPRRQRAGHLPEAVERPVLGVDRSQRASAELAQKVRQFDLPEITMDTVPHRSYPQGPVAAQMLGFVGGDLRGYYGVEGHYNDQLSGRVYQSSISNIPFDRARSSTGSRIAGATSC